MKRLNYIAFACLGLPMSGFAASQINLQEFTCSGLQTTDSVSNLTINCEGDLTMKGGTIAANGDIMLKASGRIMMDNITVDTPATISFDAALGGEMTASVVFNASGYVHPGNGVGGLRIGGDLIKPPLRPISVGSWLISPGIGGSGTFAPGTELQVSEPGIIGSIDGHIIYTSGGSSRGSGNTGAASGIIINGGSHGGAQPEPCTESTFRIKQTSKHYCGSGKTKTQEHLFLRAINECSGNPSQFQLSTSQDFPNDSTTVSMAANCSDTGKHHGVCMLYNPTTTDGVLSTPISFTGLLKLTRKANGQITELHGDVLQQTYDGCSSQTQLKSLSRQ